MRNLNEPRKPEDEVTTADIVGKGERVEKAKSTAVTNRESEVVAFDRKPGAASENVPLLLKDETDDLLNRWNSIQAGFVDEPRNAVQEADNLVARAVQRLAEVFAEERSKLEQQWSRGDKVSTEDLRVVLQRYRSFFSRLLHV